MADENKNNENNEQREDKDIELETSGKQTTINPETRTVSQGSNTPTRPGAEAEAPGNDGNVPGAPNQGTTSR